MGEAGVNSSILKVFLSIDHNETDYQTKKKLNSSKLYAFADDKVNVAQN